jgi:hypothetical protein
MSAHAAPSIDLLGDTGKEAVDAVISAANSFNDVYQGVAKYVGLFTN